MSPSLFADYSQRAFWPEPLFAESASEYLARVKADGPEMAAALEAWRRGLDETWRRWRDADRKRALADMLLTPEEPAP